MSEKKPIQELMGVTMDKIREMVDVKTIIGDPMTVDDEVTLVPVSKVSYGFASGGSDLPAKDNPKELFGGGAGAGVTITPVAFVVVQTKASGEKTVRMMPMDEGTDTIGKALKSVPELIEKISAMVKDKDKDKVKEKDKDTDKSEK